MFEKVQFLRILDIYIKKFLIAIMAVFKGIVFVTFKEGSNGSNGFLHIKIGGLDEENNIVKPRGVDDLIANNILGVMQNGSSLRPYPECISKGKLGDVQIMVTFNESDTALPQFSKLLVGENCFFSKLPSFLNSYFSMISRGEHQYDYKLDEDSYNFLRDNQFPRLERNQIAYQNIAGFFRDMKSILAEFGEEAHKALDDMMKVLDTVPDDVKRMMEALKFGAYSVNNMALAIMQWRNAGRSGAPLYLLTEDQWNYMYGRKVNGNALPIFLSIPAESGAFNASQAEANTGYNSQEVSSLNRAALSRAHWKAGLMTIGQKHFYMKAYYDYTDTTAGYSKMDFDNDYVLGNIDTSLMNKRLEELLSGYTEVYSDVVSGKDASDFANQIEVNERNVESVTNAFNELAVQQPEIFGSLKGADVYDMVRSYYMNQDFIDRDRSGNSKKALDACVFATLMMLKLDKNHLVNMFIHNPNLSNPDTFNAVKGEVYKFAKMVDSINEHRRLSSNNVDNNQQVSDVQESFRRMYNKLVEIRNRDAYGFIL